MAHPGRTLRAGGDAPGGRASGRRGGFGATPPEEKNLPLPAEGAEGEERLTLTNLMEGRLSARDAAAAWKRWYEAAGPWRRWSMCLPLLGPGLLADKGGLGALPPEEKYIPTRGEGAGGGVHKTMVNRSLARLLDTIVEALRPGPTLCLLDLPPLLGVRAAAHLAREGHAHPVLSLLRWPHARAVLPARPLADTLIAEARRLPRTVRLPNVLVVLDGERGRALNGRSNRDPRSDNRYTVSANELPSATALRAAAIQRVLAIGPGSGPDLALVLAGYETAGLSVERVAWHAEPR